MVMSVLDQILIGLATAVTAQNLIFCFLGVFLGTIIGVIPGIGALATISLLFPVTYHLEPTTALIMLAGIFYGATYGGSTATILLNLPGTPANAVTALDGYPMAQRGRAGVALFMTTIASFVGACFGISVLMAFSPAIVRLALEFGPAEYFSLILLGLVASITIATESFLKGAAMVLLGILLGVIGMDMFTAMPRFTFGWLELMEGLSIVALAMGLFGATEVIASSGRGAAGRITAKTSLRSMLPTRSELRASGMPMVRGSLVGAFFGALPGTGGTVASFASYALEQRIAHDPSRFGKGAIEGITGPESANNAADQTAFIPTLTLGIPGTATMALILGVMMVHGIQPGPRLMTERPEVFWGLVMSFWIGNLFLLLLNIPLIGLFVRILQIPSSYLFPGIIAFISVGVLSIRNNPFDVVVVAMFSLLGYAMRVLRLPPAPLLLGFVLGPMLEENFRRAMTFSRGQFDIFFASTISASFLIGCVALVLYSVWKARRRPASPTSK
jgi:putative tricarboxylic transport membrane protein